MDTKYAIKISALAVTIIVILAVVLSASTVVYAAPPSPFVGAWQAIDVDGGDIRLSIGGKPSGPFKITWTESYFGFCDGEAGIARGTGWLNEGDPYILEANLLLKCFTTGASTTFDIVWRYRPTTNTLITQYEWDEFIIIWHRPGTQLPLPPIPTFVAYLPSAIEGYDWELGDTVSININGDEYTAQTEVEEAPWDPTKTRVLFELWRDNFSIGAGDHIVMTDGFIAKEVVVTSLEVTDINLGAHTISGIYDPAYNLWVWLYDLEGQVPETDPDNGTWIATFTELPLGVWGGATQWDADGDGTSLDFQVPGGSVGNFLIEWSQTNPEEVIYLSWNGSDNLTNTWTHPNCSDDLEFFGNSWVTETGYFWASLVGWGTTGTWENPVSGEINIESISSGCPGSADIPIQTNYQFFDDEQYANLIGIERTFEFGETPYTHAVRPFIPRLYPSDGFTQVIHPNADGNALVIDTTCDFGCVAESWDGSWFAIHDPVTGLGMIVQHVEAGSPVALWLDDDDGSFTNSSSILLLQPLGGFTGTVTETEYLCFYDSTWTPSLALPEGCQP